MKALACAALGLLLLIPACKPGRGDRCAKNEDCGSGLVCFAPTEAQESFFKALSYADLAPYLADYTCVSPEDLGEASCRASENCAESGECSYSHADSSCEATTEADCRASEYCKSVGQCLLVNGSCIGTTEADCRASDACKSMGLCSSTEIMGCRATTEADCRASEFCRGVAAFAGSSRAGALGSHRTLRGLGFDSRCTLQPKENPIQCDYDTYLQFSPPRCFFLSQLKARPLPRPTA